MSRCFPFPPPGYEQKAIDCVEVVTKEKHKSKKDKDKKEKREKDSKEGRGKKHRDKNKEKRGKKRDRKDRDKNKDRDKDKDRGKDKDKDKDKDKSKKRHRRDKDRKKDRGGSSNEKALEEHAATTGDGRIESGITNDSKFREELHRRIRDEKGAGRNQMVEPAFGKVQGSGMFEKSRGFDCPMEQGAIDRQKRFENENIGVREQKFVENNNIVPGPDRGSVYMENKNRIGYPNSFGEKEAIIQERNPFGSSGVCPQKSATEQRKHFGPPNLFPEKDAIAEHRTHSLSFGASSEKNGIKEQRNHTAPPRALPKKDVAGQRSRNVSSELFAGKVGISEQKNHIVSDKDASSGQRDRPISSGVITEKGATVSGEWIQQGPSGSVGQKDASTVQDEVRHSVVSLEKDAKKKLDGKDKICIQQAGSQKTEKCVDKEKKTKSSGGKDRHKDREKKKEKHHSKEKGEQRGREHKHMRETTKREEHQPSTKPVHSLKETVDDTNFVGANLKRKGINGFVHENEMRPAKLQKTTPSASPQVENGRSSEVNHVNTLQRLERPVAVGVTEPHSSVTLEAGVDKRIGILENKEHKSNGDFRLQNTTAASSKPTMVDPLISMVDERIGILENKEHKSNGDFRLQNTTAASSKPTMVDPLITMGIEVPKKSPHPDEKYLDLVLSVPKMDEWSEEDDQEWLFGNRDKQKKPRARAESKDIPKVWDKAVRIDEDLIALPYVIPY